MRCDNAYLWQTFGGTAFGLNGATSGRPSPSACATALGGSAANPSASTFSYGSHWANIPTDQLMFLTRTMRRTRLAADGMFEPVRQELELGFLFPARRERHQHQDLQHAAVGRPPVGNGTIRADRHQRPVLALQPGAGCGVQQRRPDRLPQHHCPDLWLRAVQSLRRPAADARARSPISTARTALAAPPLDRRRSRPCVRKPSASAVNGSPIDDWAGPVSVAAGYEYREEHFSQRADPYSAGVTASTPATVNEPCTDPFIDCGLDHPPAVRSGRLECGQLSQRPRYLSM